MTAPFSSDRGRLGLIVLAGFVLRMLQLDAPALRWDEGWSIAHASLPWPALLQVSVAEWHPPAYVALLKLWRVAGASPFSVRYLSVIVGTLAVPLAYAVATAWTGRRRVGLLAALFVAWFPLLVYYGQVTRMYALVGLLVLLAAYCLLRGERRPSLAADAGLSLATWGAMLSLYHAVWPLAGLYLAGAIRRPRRTPRLVAAGAAAVALYMPWLLLAADTIRSRAGGGAIEDAVETTLRYFKETITGLAFIYDSGWLALIVLAAILVLGLLARRPTWNMLRELSLPVLVVATSVLGIAYGAGSVYFFAVRHLVPAGAFLGLLVAWSLDRLADRHRALPVVLLVALAAAYWPTSSHFVYAKTLEVDKPFDPAADHRYLAAHAAPGDLVYFNVLAKAGWYESQRRPGDPAWSYALSWLPIVEPMPRLTARIRESAVTHPRLWFAFYEGTYRTNKPVKTWLDATYYPAGGEWQGDTLYLAYAASGPDWTDVARDDRFGDAIKLRGVRFTPNAAPGGTVGVELQWETAAKVEHDYSVFVHLVDASGRLLAQHDGIPASGDRPTTSWGAGETLVDRHGLFLPPTLPEQLQLRVGLYDPATGARLRLADGSDEATVATVSSVAIHAP